MVAQSFYDVITEAVNDLAEHGYDSVERVAYWEGRIRAAMDAGMESMASIDQMLKDGLAGLYRRILAEPAIAKRHPGVSRFTIAQITPALRPILDRRIVASADLIRLNRVQMREQTLRRFSGWATSIPAGGSETVDRMEVKGVLKKAVAQQPFEVRRVLIDQGHKMAAAINQTVADQSGAIAVIWHSHWRQRGYNYRKDHKERDGKVYLLRDTWALNAGLIKVGDAGYYDQITGFAVEPFCGCYGAWVYSLGQLKRLDPAMLTTKGHDALAKGVARREAMAGSMVGA